MPRSDGFPTDEEVRRSDWLRLLVFAFGALVSLAIATGAISAQHLFVDYGLRVLIALPIVWAILDSERLSWTAPQRLKSTIKNHSYVILIPLILAYGMGTTAASKMQFVSIVCCLVLAGATLLTWRNLNSSEHPALVRLLLAVKAQNK